MNNEKLSAYVASRVRGGAKKADMKEELLAVGWLEEEADAAYARALVENGVPVPERAGAGVSGRKSSVADIMIGFFSFILLGIVVSALGTLLFEVIDRYFPDPAADFAYGSSVSSEAVHYAMAALFIGFPLYFFAIRLWFRRFREDDGRTESLLTKWVTYLVLLAAAVTIVGDLIATLYTFLQGEITARFFLKAIVVLGIASMIFSFYFLERRKIQYRKDISRTVFQSFGWGLLGVVTIGIVLGFLTAGSPETARKRAFDIRRASDLGELAKCANSYAQEFSRLPFSLTDLQKSTEYAYCPRPKDPETGDSYEYRVIKNFASSAKGEEAEFELCADFALSSSEESSSTEAVYNGSGGTPGKWGAHEAGRSCDTETVVLQRNSQK